MSKARRFKNVLRVPYLLSMKSRPGQSSDEISAVVLVVGNKHEDLALNAISSFRRTNPGIPLTAFVHQVSNSFDEALAELGQCKTIPLLQALGGLNHELIQSDFGTTDFNQIVALKWDVILSELNKTGSTVLFFDTDVFFRKNVEDILKKLSRKYAIGFQDEVGEGLWPVACTGFMFLTKRSIPFIKFMIRFTKANDYVSNDQILLNSVIRKEKQLTRHLYFFPPALFPTGRLWKQFLNVKSDYVLGELDPYVFHANFVPDTGSKTSLLKETGNWLRHASGRSSHAKLDPRK